MNELERYPYFIYPILEELRDDTDTFRAARLRELLAANVGDPQALIALIGEKEADLRNFYPEDESSALSTEATIDSFLSRFGGASELPVDSPLFPSLPVEEEETVEEETVEEYSTPEPEEEVPEEEPTVEEPEEEPEEDPEPEKEEGPEGEEPEEDPASEAEELEEEEEPEEEESEEDPEPEEEEEYDAESEPEPEPEEEPVTAVNSLERVKELVRSRNYQEALEILEAIYLNNPKKSIYFADQIRFIKKMMLNERKK